MPHRGLRRRCALVFALFAVVLLLASVAAAQEAAPPPKVDIFAGYAWTNPGGPRLDGLELSPSMRKGWGAAFTYNVNRVLGLTVDTGAHYKDPLRIGTVQAGPRLKYRGEKLQPFVQALVGLHRLSINTVPSSNTVGFTLGAGLDI